MYFSIFCWLHRFRYFVTFVKWPLFFTIYCRPLLWCFQVFLLRYSTKLHLSILSEGFVRRVYFWSVGILWTQLTAQNYLEIIAWYQLIITIFIYLFYLFDKKKTFALMLKGEAIFWNERWTRVAEKVWIFVCTICVQKLMVQCVSVLIF